MEKKLEFVKVDKALLEETSAEWLADWDGEDARPPVYVDLLHQCRRSLCGEVAVSSLSQNVWYSVKPIGSNVADALVDLLHTRQGGQLRVHQVVVAPHLELSSEDNEAQKRYVYHVAATAIVGALRLSLKDLPSTSVKLWCSYPLSRDFVQGMFAGIAEVVAVQVAGNWITMRFR